MQWWDKVVDFFRNCDAIDLVMLGSLILIPVLAVILLIVSIAGASKRRKAKAYEAQEGPVEEAAVSATIAEPVQQVKVQYQPQAVKPAERVKVKVRVTNLKKADKYLLMATGVFCFGLGMMIQRAMSKD